MTNLLEIVELLVRAKHLPQALGIVALFARLEVGKLGQPAYFFLQRLELGTRRKLCELLFGAPRRGRETVLQKRKDARLIGERAGGEQAGDQIGLGGHLDHRLHHLHAALHQIAHRDVAALADVFGGGDDLEIAVVDDRRQLLADRAVDLVQRFEARGELVAEIGALGDRLLQGLEVFLQLLCHRLGDGKAGGIALSDAQPVHDLVELARARRDLRGDQLAVVGGLGRYIARGRGRDFARSHRHA